MRLYSVVRLMPSRRAARLTLQRGLDKAALMLAQRVLEAKTLCLRECSGGAGDQRLEGVRCRRRFGRASFFERAAAVEFVRQRGGIDDLTGIFGMQADDDVA